MSQEELVDMVEVEDLQVEVEEPLHELYAPSGVQRHLAPLSNVGQSICGIPI